MPKIAAALERPVGPLPVWGWLIVGVGGVGVFYFIHKGGGGSSSQQTSLVPATSGTPLGSDNTAQDPHTLLLDQILAQLQANNPTNPPSTSQSNPPVIPPVTPPVTLPPLPPIAIPPIPPISVIPTPIPTPVPSPTPVTPTPGQTTGWLNFGHGPVPAGTSWWDQFNTHPTVNIPDPNTPGGQNWNPALGAYQFVGNLPGSFIPAPINAFQTHTDLIHADPSNPADVAYIASNYYQGNTTSAIAGIQNAQNPATYVASNAAIGQQQAAIAAANAKIYGNPTSPTFTGKAKGTP